MKKREFHLLSSHQMNKIAERSLGEYTIVPLSDDEINFTYLGRRRMEQVMRDSNAVLVYADYREIDENGVITDHPLIDYQPGSIRDDFDFGKFVLVKTRLLEKITKSSPIQYEVAGWYHLRLQLSLHGPIVHIPEYLYTSEPAKMAEGESQFNYVDPRNRESQKEMEAVCRAYLSAIKAYVYRQDRLETVFNTEIFPVEASVIIPVKNRCRTIADAVGSALSQKADFGFNVIVVDNGSTDGTSEILANIAAKDSRLIVIDTRLTGHEGLGIGGCWNLALNSEHCGQFAIQLDSDDLYNAPGVISRIVKTFYEKKCAMVVGSYLLTDFDKNVIPPGLISHDEWTDENGCNNALRINGFGAPRAFYTPIAREISFPNVSYGEDYAMGLAISRRFIIGRIYEPLYLCRRWEDNTDHALPLAKINEHNYYKDRIRTIELEARKTFVKDNYELRYSPIDNYHDLMYYELRYNNLLFNNLSGMYDVLLNEKHVDRNPPEACVSVRLLKNRKKSLSAKVGDKDIASRPCFLCKENRQPSQLSYILKKYEILANPYPIDEVHLTISSIKHTPQRIKGRISDMAMITNHLEDLCVIYNGPRCGASAPDHFHFQALPQYIAWEFETLDSRSEVIAQVKSNTIYRSPRDANFPFILITTKKPADLKKAFDVVYDALPADDPEPMMNIAMFEYGDNLCTVVIPRAKHRPSFYGTGEGQLLISPATVEMLGTIVTSRQEDFDRMDSELTTRMYDEVTISMDEYQKIVEKIQNSLETNTKK